NVLVHIVFSTKERHSFLLDTELRAAMHKYLVTVSTHLRCPVISVGGVEDHVHILGRPARTITLAEWVKELKRTSSLWAKEGARGRDVFQWQAGYGAFSVSQSQSAAVARYIARQAEHHRRLGFQEELRTLLKRHEIEYDERYVWD